MITRNVRARDITKGQVIRTYSVFGTYTDRIVTLAVHLAVLGEVQLRFDGLGVQYLPEDDEVKVVHP